MTILLVKNDNSICQAGLGSRKMKGYEVRFMLKPDDFVLKLTILY